MLCSGCLGVAYSAIFSSRDVRYFDILMHHHSLTSSNDIRCFLCLQDDGLPTPKLDSKSEDFVYMTIVRTVLSAATEGGILSGQNHFVAEEDLG